MHLLKAGYGMKKRKCVCCRGAIKATVIISGLMVFAVVASVVAIKTGFVDQMRGRQAYQTMSGNTGLELR